MLPNFVSLERFLGGSFANLTISCDQIFRFAPQLKMVRLPLHPLVCQVLNQIQLTLIQLDTNAYRILYSCLALNPGKWRMCHLQPRKAYGGNLKLVEGGVSFEPWDEMPMVIKG